MRGKYVVKEVPPRWEGKVNIDDQIRIIDVYEMRTILEIKVLSGASSGMIFFIPTQEIKNRLERIG